MRKLLFLFSLVFMFVWTACRKNFEYPPNQTACGFTYLEQVHNKWELAVIQWPGSYLTDGRDCLDTVCSYFDLDLEDSSRYNMAYHLIIYRNNMLFDTIKGKEVGNFRYEYCHTDGLFEPFRPYTNQGTFEFDPKSGPPRVMEFTSDPKYRFWLRGELIPGKDTANYYFGMY